MPAEADRSGGPGAVVTWFFLGGAKVAPGTDSELLVIRTNAPSYDIFQLASVIDGASVDVGTIGPSNTLISPEPASIGAIAIAGVLLGRRRREK